MVTGAAGQVGQAIHSIHDQYDYSFIFADRHILDITDREAVEQFVQEHDIDIIINCAAYTAVDLAESDSDLCYLINDQAVGFLAGACAQKGGLFFHISSDYVYHPEHDEPLTETDSTNPKGVYAKSKLAGEKRASDCCPQSIILRTSWVYSTTGKNFVKTIDRLGSEKDHLTVVNDQIGSPTYAADIARVILDLIELSNSKDIWGTYNFCNDGYISWFDFASEIIRFRDYPCEVSPVPSSAYPTAASRPNNSRLNTLKIQDLGISLRPWKASLHECLSAL